MLVRILIFILLLMLFPWGFTAAEDPEIVTLEGKVSLKGSEPLVMAVLAREDSAHTLSGEMDLKKLQGLEIRVQGLKGEPVLPGTHGNIEVFRYKVLSMGKECTIDWVVGVLKELGGEIFLLGDDWRVYRIMDLPTEIIDRIKGKRVILKGEVENVDAFRAIMSIESYRVIE